MRWQPTPANAGFVDRVRRSICVRKVAVRIYACAHIIGTIYRIE